MAHKNHKNHIHHYSRLCVCAHYLRSRLANYVVIFGRVWTGRTWLDLVVSMSSLVCVRAWSAKHSIANAYAWTLKTITLGEEEFAFVGMLVCDRNIWPERSIHFSPIEYLFYEMTAEKNRRVKNICAHCNPHPSDISFKREQIRFFRPRRANVDVWFRLCSILKYAQFHRTTNGKHNTIFLRRQFTTLVSRTVSHRRSWRNTLCVCRIDPGQW